MRDGISNYADTALADAALADAPDTADTDGMNRTALWPGDLGTLPEMTRRALLRLIKGPYLSRTKHSNLWSALISDQTAIRSRLNDLFLDLMIDEAYGVAFVQNIKGADFDAPSAVRTAGFTFIDTILFITLRQFFINANDDERVIVGKDELLEQLTVFGKAKSLDDSAFKKRFDSSWRKMRDYGIIGDTKTEDRVEVSPVIRLIFGIEQITALRNEYLRIVEDSGLGNASGTLDTTSGTLGNAPGGAGDVTGGAGDVTGGAGDTDTTLGNVNDTEIIVEGDDNE
jgi:hypothetical protein